MPEGEPDLAKVAGELNRLAPGLRVEVRLEGSVPVLEARSPLSAGVARVHVAYRPDGYVMMALEPVGVGRGATAHLRSADAGAIAAAVAEWATRPLRVVLPHPPNALELRRRTVARVRRAIAEADDPPALAGDGGPSAVDRALAVFHFPRDQRGRMLTAVRVLIEVREAGPPGRRSRCRFLRLRAGTLETFESEDFVENQEHRWHLQTWRWSRNTAALPSAERWGVADLPAAEAAAGRLETGAQEEALAAFGVQIGPGLGKVLAGEPLDPISAGLAERWGTVAGEELAAAAPWRLAALASKTWIRLFGLGGSGAQVKPVVALGLRGGSPTLDVIGSGSNRRLAREDWQRPLDFEALRVGIELPAALRPTGGVGAP